MNLKVKAGLITAGLLGTAITTVLATRLALTYISVEMIPHLLMGLGLAICIYTMYDITLTKLKYNQKLKDMVDLNRK